jgi:hypothetical protein
MHQLSIPCRRWRVFVVCTVLLIGCASTQPVRTSNAVPRPLRPPSADSAWWYARFSIDWPESAAPAWHMDLLIAHRIVRPSLERHQQDISLWRFHRRAARDAAGHQFSFIFYAAPQAAQAIYAELSGHPVIQEARASGRITGLIFDDPASVSKPAVADTSDASWPAALRQAWPYYLMGASQMWLDLISAMAAGAAEAEMESVPDCVELENQYAEVNTSITALWQNEGRHAFLHHLNALFGYEPILIIEKRHMRF